jgi:hypothetical protein
MNQHLFEAHDASAIQSPPQADGSDDDDDESKATASGSEDSE